MKRVLMVFRHPLFGHGVEKLLGGEPGLEVVGWETDASKVMERIQALRPDVVIVDGGDRASDPLAEVMCILREGTGTKVIALNLQDNSMCVYRGEQRMVKDVADLVAAITQSELARAGEIGRPDHTAEPDDETTGR